jgi:hypothetical protein
MVYCGEKRSADIFDLTGLHVLECPVGRYMADPFVVESKGEHYLFYEDYDYTKGRIAVGVLNGTQLIERRICLETDKHLSFPCVLEFEDSYFMVPEQSASRELWLWKAQIFPDRWYKYCRVSCGKYHDPVLRVSETGSLQIYTTNNDDKLCVFEALAPEGPWKQLTTHAYKGRFNRSAGHFIGSLRPVQESTPVYGRAIHLVGPKGDCVRSIEPDWYPNLNGTHTINCDSDYVVVDGRLPLLPGP